MTAFDIFFSLNMIFFLFKITMIFLFFFLFIILLVFLFPSVQGFFLFMNYASVYPNWLFPLHVYKPKHAEYLNLKSKDGLQLGAWMVYSKDMEPKKGNGLQRIVLYCHGNASNRGHPRRVRSYDAIMKITVADALLTFDYRGYGDSHGHPSEHGLFLDALAAYDCVSKFNASEIIIWGHSLGTGVACALVSYLTSSTEYKKPSALFLESPFLSVPKVVVHHPLATLMRFLPNSFVQRLIENRFVFKFDSETKVGAGFCCPLMILHSADDRVIPFAHGKRLFEVALKTSGLVNSCFLENAGHNNITFHPDIETPIKTFLFQVRAKTNIN